jgi:hypothetical protein
MFLHLYIASGDISLNSFWTLFFPKPMPWSTESVELHDIENIDLPAQDCMVTRDAVDRTGPDQTQAAGSVEPT